MHLRAYTSRIPLGTIQSVTLILSALSDNVIVQVSDRRLTKAGKLYDDNANKAISVTCADAAFILGYAGMALIKGNWGDRTDVWVADYLSSLPLGDVGWVQVIECLRKAITEKVAQVHGIAPDGTRLAFMACGYSGPHPFGAHITNFEDENGRVVDQVSSEFRARYFLRNKKKMERLDFISIGTDKALDAGVETAIRKVRARMFGRRPRQIVSSLIQIIRNASKNPIYGRYVGRDCMGCVFAPGRQPTFQYLPEKTGKTIYAPHMVGPGVSARNVSVEVDGPNSFTVRGYFKFNQHQAASPEADLEDTLDGTPVEKHALPEQERN